MNVNQIVRKSQKFVNDNSPSILTGLGVAGTLATAYLAARASFKAARTIMMVEETGYEMDTKKKVKLVWHMYLPTLASAAVTTTSICLARKIDAKRLTAITAAYAITDQAFGDYKSKVVEKLGENKATKIHDEVMQDKMKDSVVPPQLVIVPENKVLCLDTYSGRYFHSTMQDIKRAENEVAYENNHAYSVCLQEFYDRLGLEATSISENIGWTSDDMVTLSYTSGLSGDTPCLAISFDTMPHPI